MSKPALVQGCTGAFPRITAGSSAAALTALICVVTCRETHRPTVASTAGARAHANAAPAQNGAAALASRPVSNGDDELMEEDEEDHSSEEGNPEEAGEETEISDFDDHGEPASSGGAANGSALRPSYGRKVSRLRARQADCPHSVESCLKVPDKVQEPEAIQNHAYHRVTSTPADQQSCFLHRLQQEVISEGFCHVAASLQSALEARSKIGVKPTRKYVRKKSVQSGSEQGPAAAEMPAADQHMTGMDSAHSGSPGLEGMSPG